MTKIDFDALETMNPAGVLEVLYDVAELAQACRNPGHLALYLQNANAVADESEEGQTLAEEKLQAMTMERDNLLLQVRALQEDKKSVNQPLVDDIERWRKEAENGMGEARVAKKALRLMETRWRRERNRADKAEAVVQRHKDSECMPREVVEPLLKATLPCGHPNNCAYTHDGGRNIGCGWCDALHRIEELTKHA